MVPAPTGERSTRSGPGKVLIAVYGVFALAACARAGVQIATRFNEAPLAYLLSALAGVIYLLATIMLARGTRTSRRIATVALLVELVGVLVVGTLSVLDPTRSRGRRSGRCTASGTASSRWSCRSWGCGGCTPPDRPAPDQLRGCCNHRGVEIGRCQAAWTSRSW